MEVKVCLYMGCVQIPKHIFDGVPPSTTISCCQKIQWWRLRTTDSHIPGKTFCSCKDLRDKRAILPHYLKLVNASKPWKNGPRQKRPLLESVTILSSRKSDKTPNKKQKTDFFCEYCSMCNSFLQSARKSCDKIHGLDKMPANSNAGIHKCVMFKEAVEKSI